ncbi:MAG: putative lipid II flippase FtsW [Clostridia bacterium]|nr:putative lipid II flippase FtsW [Clostridia bacterium]
MINYKKKNKGNLSILFAVIFLASVGVVFIYSASNYSAFSTYKDSLFFVKKQAIGVVIGIIAMFIMGYIDYRRLKKICIPLAIITIVLLLLVFVPKIGVENYGAKRWIKLGPLTMQPSEIAKFSLILFCASYYSDNPEKSKSFWGNLPVILYGIILCLLIIIEPNMSITVCVGALMLSMLFASGMKIKHLTLLLLPALILGVVLILIAPYRLNRLYAFLDPWSNPKGEGYQLLQSLYALGSGGWFGVGLFKSRQKYAFLPFAESDFILSVIGEEVGFVGLLVLLLIYLFVIISGIKIAGKSNDLFGYLLAVGISLIFGIQTIINVLVVSGSIPPTGLSLPLLSSGNTSIIIFMAEIGVLYNISRNNSLTF